MDAKQRSGVRARGDSIQIDFYYRGRRCRETLRLPPTVRNLNAAGHKRAAVMYAMQQPGFRYRDHFPNSPNLQELGERSPVTVKLALERFLDSKLRTCAPSTYRDYKSAVDFHLVPEFGLKLLDGLTTAEIKAWIGLQTMSAKRVNNVLIPLRAVCADAFADGQIERDPMQRVRNLPHQTKDPDPLSRAEVDELLAATDGQTRNLFEFLIYTGLRTSEVIALEWSDIDLERRLVFVRRASVRKRVKDTKTKAGRRDVKLIEPAYQALRRQRPLTALQRGHVFHNPRTGKPWETDGQIRKTAWAPALKAAGIRYRPAYQTRHTYASLALSAGEQPMFVAQQMGHRDWGMIRKVYGRWIPDADDTAGQKLTALWSRDGHSEAASD